MGWGWCLDNTIVPAMRVAFSIKRSLFLEVTPGEIQQEGEKPLRRRKAWAFGRSSTQNFMQLAGRVHRGRRAQPHDPGRGRQARTNEAALRRFAGEPPLAAERAGTGNPAGLSPRPAGSWGTSSTNV